MKQLGVFTAAVVILVLGAGTRGAEKGERPLDKDFLIKMASCNHAEAEISKLADKRAESKAVKDFATKLVRDHKETLKRIAQLLDTRKIGVVAGLNKEMRDEVNRLSKLEGGDFDRAYLQCMIKEHKNAIAIVEHQAKDGQDVDVRAYAEGALPVLRKHLDKAKELAKTVKR